MRPDLRNILRTGALVLLTAAVVHPARALDPACKPAFDALHKQLATPSHLYSTKVRPGGKPEATEAIQTNTAIYVRIHGRWTRSPLTVQAWRQQEEENERNAKSLSCRYLRDETSDGEAAAVYHVQTVTEADGKSDSTLWISKRTGLPLRSENDIDTGDKDGRMHVAIRYGYTDVQPPAGVK